MGITVILSYSALPAMDGMIGAAVWVLSTIFYLWVSYPLFPSFYQHYIDEKNNPKKRKKRPPTQMQKREQMKATVKMWIMLTLYSALYLTLQFTPLQHAMNLVELDSKYKPMGRMFPRNADNLQSHLFCTGFTDPDAEVDDRPVVIFEAMEGLGQALAMAGVQEKISRVGIACSYDRAGV